MILMQFLIAPDVFINAPLCGVLWHGKVNQVERCQCTGCECSADSDPKCLRVIWQHACIKRRETVLAIDVSMLSSWCVKSKTTSR